MYRWQRPEEVAHSDELRQVGSSESPPCWRCDDWQHTWPPGMTCSCGVSGTILVSNAQDLLENVHVSNSDGL